MPLTFSLKLSPIFFTKKTLKCIENNNIYDSCASKHNLYSLCGNNHNIKSKENI